MVRIKITDMPADKKIIKKEMHMIFGGPTRRAEMDPVGLYNLSIDVNQFTVDTLDQSFMIDKK